MVAHFFSLCTDWRTRACVSFYTPATMLLILLMAVHGCVGGYMDVVHSWKTVDFAFPSAAARDAMLRTGRFIPANIAVIDVDVWEGPSIERSDHVRNVQKVFVTMPRFKAGTPATLATVGSTGLLTPYPEWAWHKLDGCNGIVSVFRTDIDHCGRLWVLDTGTIDIFTGEPKKICPPKILVFDLKTDKLIRSYQLPDNVYDPKSLFITIAVDVRDNACQDTFAYLADVITFKLVVFNQRNGQFWRVSSNYFYPYPSHGRFDMNGVTFDLMDGLFALALGPINYGDRRLYFHSLASVKEGWVSTSVLRNSSIFLADEGGAQRAFQVTDHSRPAQSAAEAMTKSGILFFGLLPQNSIVCWNSRLSYTKDNMITVAKNDMTLQFLSGMKVRGDRLWALASELQNYIVDNVPANETNYRVVAGSIKQLTSGTKCRNGGGQTSQNLWSYNPHKTYY